MCNAIPFFVFVFIVFITSSSLRLKVINGKYSHSLCKSLPTRIQGSLDQYLSVPLQELTENVLEVPPIRLSNERVPFKNRYVSHSLFWMVTWYFWFPRYVGLRHGQSDANVEGIISSNPNVGINSHGLTKSLGIEQAKVNNLYLFLYSFTFELASKLVTTCLSFYWITLWQWNRYYSFHPISKRWRKQL